MILREVTIKYSGIDPDTLKPKSKKRICVSCDQCGRVRWISKFNDPSPLCRSCSKSGKNNSQYGMGGELNSNYGKHLTDEHKAKISNSNHWNWQGGKITLLCHECGDEYRVKQHYKDKSKFCSLKCMNKYMSENLFGENNPFYGHKHTDEYKLIHSTNGMGSNNPNWRGGCNRKHVLPKNQCIQLNSYFKGSNAHHIMSGVVIFIPKKLHQSIWHDIKNNKNMNEINKLAMNYLVGDY